jgi:protein-L-isoaspartate O-methyltransferase
MAVLECEKRRQNSSSDQAEPLSTSFSHHGYEEQAMKQANSREAAYEVFPEIPFRDSLQVGIEVPLLVNLLRIPTGGRVLEVGCRSGRTAAVLCRRAVVVGENACGLVSVPAHEIRFS